MSKDDFFTQIYFNRLLENENSMMFLAYKSDIESLIVFPYKNNYKKHLQKLILKTLSKLNIKMSKNDCFFC